LTGLSVTTLEYIILIMSLLYTIAAFYEYRTRKTLLGQTLRLVLMVIPYLETRVRAYRERAKRDRL
jgi:hypothetical protein